MLFKVTHIDLNHRRHRMEVTAANNDDALRQVEQVYGDARTLSCVRVSGEPMPLRAGLRLVTVKGRRWQACA